ncbi:hypothetical protein PMAYCL1PPCAC_28200, partial [Pristionchus mayeri]
QVPRSFDAIRCKELFGVYGAVYQVIFPMCKAEPPKRDQVFVTFYRRKDAISALDALHNLKTLPGMERPIKMRPVDEKLVEILGQPLDSIFAPFLLLNSRLMIAGKTAQQDEFETVLHDVLTGGSNRLAASAQPVNNAVNPGEIHEKLHQQWMNEQHLKHQQWLNEHHMQPALPAPGR